MSPAVASDQEQRERQVRLMVIVGLAAAVLLGGLAVSIIGSQQASDRADDLRRAASTAIVDPSLIALTAYATDSDPVSDALGPDRVVSLQQMDDRWCVETEVSALLSSRTVFFVIDNDGRFVETPDCRE
jgi:hypothetical protein